jgi:hypothetical protein
MNLSPGNPMRKSLRNASANVVMVGLNIAAWLNATRLAGLVDWLTEPCKLACVGEFDMP